MFKQILVMPMLSYTAIILLLLGYILVYWRKRTFKQNIKFTVFCLGLLLTAYQILPSINERLLWDAFYADSVQIKCDDKLITVALDDLFQGQYGSFSKSESIVDIVKNFNQKPLLEMVFYQRQRQLLKLKMYQVDGEEEYAAVIDDRLVVVKYNGKVIKFNPIFYESLNRHLH